MANNLASCDEEEHEVRIDIQAAECCIHKVPRNLREVNPEAYTPQLVSIGPYHHGQNALADMENHKRRYMNSFGQRIPYSPDRKKEILKFVGKKEKRIRRQYAEPLDIPSDEFVEMIILDAVFIIELLWRFGNRDSYDFLLNEVWLRAIRRDLLLLENQLPYFLLEGLYNLAFTSASKDEVSDDERIPFTSLSVFFFELNRSHNRPLSCQSRSIKINHFTDLCRYALVEIPKYPKFKLRITSEDILPNALKLKNSGLKFEPCRNRYLVDIQYQKIKSPMSFSTVVELQIPPIEITDNTECLIRNLMALELCHYPSKTYICSYIQVMDSLINTEDDVDLLVEKGIIVNFMGNNSVIADMFNELCRQVPLSYTYYDDLCCDVNEHYESAWNHTMTTLRRVYFSNLWRGTATAVAIILLLLTLTQTVFSILQVVLPNQMI
ncbi:putative UPF0481 protein At3g02645 [Pistacia vera]|uniref:putative UPF0481 protein At3g02645 n=1 Tax=Pistacia vera TaxID=55513 RepID=UPI001263880C|nr:putative UPF0481 protein At3g02645 [Pistacia vera]XP_031261077.1 putative UPF0481 protein At3g02645 [Pistacia vera]XP_031261086.1 putative UPF0481 protein At3g02645 [Pistacia vera]XP_031261088.1 putative UPF0481 protein At3g02645 [Pistacia vera]XP_031261096.1 putative UPF0481 protein At3g02645 [Pistacia vera]